MANFQLLNADSHKQLRVKKEFLSELGYDWGVVNVVPSEFQILQREYPILFRQHTASNSFLPVVMLGFEQNENLMLSGDGQWLARYVPLSVAKGPFQLALEAAKEGNSFRPVIHIDVDDARIVEQGGEPIFDKSGELSSGAAEIGEILLALHNGSLEISRMVEAFTACELIEPLALEVEFNNGDKINFGGAFTISENKINALSGAQLKRLIESDFLSAAYYVAGSLANVQNLIDIKNKKI